MEESPRSSSDERALSVSSELRIVYGGPQNEMPTGTDVHGTILGQQQHMMSIFVQELR